MIPEERQDQAALYVLDALEPNDAAAFVAVMGNDPELRTLVGELRESAAAMALSVPVHQPPTELKARIAREIAIEKSRTGVTRRPAAMSWLPWSIAALFMIFSGLMVYDHLHLRRELESLRARDPLAGINFIALAPQKDAPQQAKAVVAWEATKQSGMIRVTGLQPVPGKNYQLWAIDAAHKDPVSAGIVGVDKNGTAQVRFTPVAATHEVKAFAISLESEGGAAKPKGPILLVGSTT